MLQLPDSSALERAVLACVLLQPDSAAALELPGEAFSGAHRAVWEAFLEVIEDKGPGALDLQTAAAVLEERGQLERTGGLAFLAGLDMDLPDLGRAQHYADSLRRLFFQRQLLLACASMQDRLGAEDWPDALDALGNALAEARASGGPGASRFTCMADVEPEEVVPLWAPRIFLGKLTLLEGDPGQGKSFLTAALATAGSVGQGLPGIGAFSPWRSLFFTAEDGLGDTLAPRLEAMGANRGLIYAHDAPLDFGTDAGLAEVRAGVKTFRPRLVIIDPIVAYVGRGTNTHRANDVRSVLAPLAKLAEEFECAILVVRHLSKSHGGKSLYRGQGSIDFTAAARSVLLAGSDPETGTRALVHLKSNLAPTAKSLTYSIGADRRLVWGQESDLTAADILRSDASDESRSAGEEAEGFLLELLASGPVAARDVQQAARDAGIAKATLDRAKTKLGVKAKRSGFGAGGRWTWMLSDTPPASSNGHGAGEVVRFPFSEGDPRRTP